MKKLILFAIKSLLVFNFSFGQDRTKHAELIKEARSLYENNEFLKSGQKFSEAFVAFGAKGMVTDITQLAHGH